jgi:hydrogen cyanide synthase HcnC
VTRAVDTVVVGGGVIGCSVAYYAARRGLRVVLIDSPKRGRATSASAGGLWPAGESLGIGCGVIFFKAMLKGGEMPTGTLGPPPLPASFFEFAVRSNAMFPTLTEELRETAGMDVEFDRTSLLFLMYDSGDVAFAESLKASFPDNLSRMDWLTPQELAKAEPAITREVEGAVRLHEEDQVNPYRLADALRAAAQAHGATVVPHTEVSRIRTEGNRVVAVETSDEVFPCGTVVNAAGAWAGQIGRMVDLDIPVEPVRGQMICSETLPPMLNACVSTSDGYLAQKRHGEIIVGSTTEETGFDVSVTPAAMRDLSAGAIRAVPALARVNVKRVWAGLRPGTPDELPILGSVEGLEGYLNACGHFRTGIVTSPMTGKLLAELLAGDPTSLPIEPFLQCRFTCGTQ